MGAWCGWPVFGRLVLVVFVGCGGKVTSGTGGTGVIVGTGGMGGTAGAAGSGGSVGGGGGDIAGVGGTGGEIAGTAGTGGEIAGTAGTGGSLPCTDVGYDIDIPSTLLTGTIKVNGTTVTSAIDRGTLTLRRAVGDQIPLGSTSPGTFSVRVVPGTYDVVYRVSSPGAIAPGNLQAKLRTLTIVGAGTATLDIDIPSVVVTGTMKINGATVTSAADAGRLYLRNAYGDEVALGNTAAGTYSVRAIPGTYDVVYRYDANGATAPRNTAAKLGSVVVAATGTTVLDVDVPSVAVSGTFTFNGTTSTSTADAGFVLLSGSSSPGDSVGLGTSTALGSYSVRVVPGTYDLIYVNSYSTSLAPRNIRAKLRSVTIAATGATTLDVDVPSVTLSGAYKLNGATMPLPTPDTGNLELINAAGDRVVLQQLATSYSVRLVPGSYDVIYRLNAAATPNAPQNTYARVRTVDVAATGATTQDIDIPSVEVSGMLTINGATVTSTSDSGSLLLQNADGGTVLLGYTSLGSYSVRAIPGTYDVYYRASATAGAIAPRNKWAKLRSGVVVATTGTTVLDVDVPSSAVTGSISFNGTPATSTTDVATLSVQSGPDSSVTLGTSSAGSYSTRLIPGDYELDYQANVTSTVAPRNMFAPLRCFTVR